MVETVTLFVYSLIALLLFLWLNKRRKKVKVSIFNRIVRLPFGIGLLFIMPLFIIVVELMTKPFMMGFVGKGYEFFCIYDFCVWFHFNQPWLKIILKL